MTKFVLKLILMGSRMKSLWLIFGFVLSTASLADAKTCSRFFKSTSSFRFARSIENSQGAYLLWFPDNPDSNQPFSAVKIAIDGTVYGVYGKYIVHGKEVALVRLARTQKNIEFFRFKLNLSSEEVSSLKEKLESGEVHGRNCIGGACKALRDSTSLRIPFPFKLLPSATALYLTAKGVRARTSTERDVFIGKDPMDSIFNGNVSQEAAVLMLAGAIAAFGSTLFLF